MNPTPPTTPLQHAMVLHGLESGEGAAYFQQLVCELEEPLEVVALVSAWGDLVERHAALRTSFRLDDQGLAVQVIAPSLPISMTEIDGSSWDEAETDLRTAEFLGEDRRRGFDVLRPPLWRLTLFRLGPSRFRWVWSSHHALLDGRSRRRLLVELFEMYDALVQGRTPATRPAPRPFADHATWLASRDPLPSRSYFASLLHDFRTPTPVPLADLQPRREGLGSEERHGQQEVVLPAAETTRLAEIAAQADVSVHTWVQAAWALLLARCGGVDDVVFGEVRAGRRSGLPGSEAMIGLLIVTMPVRIRLPTSIRLGDWWRQIRDQWRELREHETTPLSTIQLWSGLPPRQPLFRTLLSFENSGLADSLRTSGGAGSRRRFRLLATTNYPLVATATLSDVLRIELTHDRQLIPDEGARRLASLLGGLLRRFAESGTDDSLARVPLLSSAEEQRLVADGSPVTKGVPPGDTIHARFEKQAALTPEATALVHGPVSFTYRELNARANRLAHRLRARGVRPEVPVGICLDRDPDLIVGLLAILKAGGAYVPLDPTYPPDRLDFMIRDAGLVIVITRKAGAAFPVGHGIVEERVDEVASPGAAATEENPVSGATAESLAYVMYTSGSTGRPKGVLIAHRGVIRLVCDVDYVELGPLTRLLHHSPITFDASTFEV